MQRYGSAFRRQHIKIKGYPEVVPRRQWGGTNVGGETGEQDHRGQQKGVGVTTE